MTTLEIINIAKISQFLAANYLAKSGLLGGGRDLKLPRKLYVVRKDVEWLYNLQNNNSTLVGTGNYLYALCAPYNQEALYILNNGNGGSVSPINPSSPPEPLDFTVADAGTPIISGQSTLVIPEFSGYNLLFSRGGIVQSQNNTGGTYYTWNRDTAEFTCIGAAVVDEPFILFPYN